MQRAMVLFSVLVAACGASGPLPIVTARDPERDALVERLCEPLPTRAFDCVVGWPASVAPERRAAATTASEGSVWSRGGVRAFASCGDRPAEDGPVAHVVVVLLDSSALTDAEVEARLPVQVRWTSACEGSETDCASYVAARDGDRVIITRRVPRPLATDENVARRACAAVADGAEEAHARLSGDDALIRELHVDDEGLAVVTRRPGGRGETERVRRSWTELELDAADDRIEHDAIVRAAAAARVIAPDDVDVANLVLLEVQIGLRQRRLRERRDDERLRELRALGRLADRGFEAHPSRPDVGLVAVHAWLEAGEGEAARRSYDAIERVLGPGAPELDAVGRAVQVASDRERLVDAIARRHPTLDRRVAESIADALRQDALALPYDTAAIARLARAERALVAATDATEGPTTRAHGAIAPAWGVGWALTAITEHVPTTLRVCRAAGVETRPPRARAGDALTTFAEAGRCVAVALEETPTPSALRAAAIEALTGASGPVRITLEAGGDRWSLRGSVEADGALRLAAVDPRLSEVDFGRLQREVVAPLAALGERVFPSPVLVVPIPPARRSEALGAVDAIEQADCEVDDAGLRCTALGGATEALVEVAMTAYRAGL